MTEVITMPECNVEGCDEEAVGAVIGEDGYAMAYRCRNCLAFDLDLREVPA